RQLVHPPQDNRPTRRQHASSNHWQYRRKSLEPTLGIGARTGPCFLPPHVSATIGLDRPVASGIAHGGLVPLQFEAQCDTNFTPMCAEELQKLPRQMPITYWNLRSCESGEL